jgi:predicted nucleic acid-binding protein
VSFYLDASAALPNILEEPGSALVDAFIDQSGGDLVISEFVAGEVSSAISRLVRTNELDLEDALERLAEFDGWRLGHLGEVEVSTADLVLAHSFVRQFALKLRLPDAVHAALCQRHGHHLVTMDKTLADAAMALNIPTTLLQVET